MLSNLENLKSAVLNKEPSHVAVPVGKRRVQIEIVLGFKVSMRFSFDLGLMCYPRLVFVLALRLGLVYGF